MSKIAISTSALKTGYRFQGTGNYISHLVDGLKELNDGNKYYPYTQDEKCPAVDIVHIPYFSPFMVTLPYIKPAKKLIVTVHDLTPVVYDNFFSAGVRGKYNWYLQKFLLKHNIDHVLADSSSSKDEVLSHLNLENDKVSVVYLAADRRYTKLQDKPKVLANMQKKYNLPEKFVLYVGDVLWSKNLPSLIEAVKEINVTLVLVGKQFVDEAIDLAHPWNIDLAKVRQVIKGDRRYITLGFVPDEDLVELYNVATLYCQPSHSEGFGIPVLEAMSCGCPVVVSDAGSLPEVAGEAGVYVDPADVRSIADGIGELYFNQKKNEIHRVKALEQAQKFSWEKTVNQTVAIYNKLIDA
ncbi:hypothetical protein COW99_02655 [Candidatus Roizmanbacteria bacterium CG22_combo_CG10-13_8_21_14_all_38_20]|uniref:Glycosyl transferase family 1 n=1 Tax=Candidatus Roizmanbacteria bacterium CG22_combo_CG10-13_8_21_14_all_38_20 TaxID=1974862 RepID=A0A2H0BVP3_9BACT|nr:glycosyltransferase family 4 protein [Candidatus Microgenomates bacterium]PIP61756.1 MAG: hypothetical protein COW99_02655 [Candidatus Roizmanbacteria bacterium CG22_combo_CG10-13_8_21_14_all_38_20]PJC32064.1 MAG: hypothetical protein CO050_01040 [Candidatus Roizmanbacteria bacterium CG_4_9_14_0_2_um_filter_38_17]